MGGVKRKAPIEVPGRKSRSSDGRGSSALSSSSGNYQSEVFHVDSRSSTSRKPINLADLKVNDRLFCLFRDNVYYEAKIIKIEEDKLGRLKFRLHYPGWSGNYDEDVTAQAALDRFIEYNKENAELSRSQREMSKSVKRARSSKSRRSTHSMTPIVSQSVETMMEPPVKVFHPVIIVEHLSAEDLPPEVTPPLEDSELDEIPKPEIFLSERIHKLLDKDRINMKSMKLLKLPARKTLKNVFDDFLKSNKTKKPQQLLEGRISMLTDFFNYYLSFKLLYKNENEQFIKYANILRKQHGLPEITFKEYAGHQSVPEDLDFNSDDSEDDGDVDYEKNAKSSMNSLKIEPFFVPDFTKIYGVMHYFRLCNYVPDMMQKPEVLSPGIYKYVADTLNDVTRFINDNLKCYFDPELDYEDGTMAGKCDESVNFENNNAEDEKMVEKVAESVQVEENNNHKDGTIAENHVESVQANENNDQQSHHEDETMVVKLEPDESVQVEENNNHEDGIMAGKPDESVHFENNNAEDRKMVEKVAESVQVEENNNHEDEMVAEKVEPVHVEENNCLDDEKMIEKVAESVEVKENNHEDGTRAGKIDESVHAEKNNDTEDEKMNEKVAEPGQVKENNNHDVEIMAENHDESVQANENNDQQPHHEDETMVVKLEPDESVQLEENNKPEDEKVVTNVDEFAQINLKNEKIAL